MGRFRFDLYEAVDAAGEVVCGGEAYFPKRRAREWHKTEGFREGDSEINILRSCRFNNDIPFW